MNPEQMLNEVEEAIDRRASSANDRWTLVVRKKAVLCVSTKSVKRFETVIRRFGFNQVTHGFTAPEWHQIKNRIGILQKAGVL